MLTDRFEPIDLKDLDRKATYLQSRSRKGQDRYVIAVRESNAASGAARCRAIEDNQHDTATRWAARMIEAMPITRAARNNKK